MQQQDDLGDADSEHMGLGSDSDSDSDDDGTLGGGEHDGCMGRGATRCGVGSRSANGISLGGRVFPPNVAPGARPGGPGRARARFGENGAGGKRRRATERHGGMGRGATGWGEPLGAQCFLGGPGAYAKKAPEITDEERRRVPTRSLRVPPRANCPWRYPMRSY